MTFEVGEASEKHARKRPKPGLPTRITGIFGELLVTAGVLVLLFLGWQVWLNDIIVGAEQGAAASKLGQTWERGEGTSPPRATAPATPVVMAQPALDQRFGILIVPRWGADYQRPIAEGIGIPDVLDKIGLGHYPGTQMPGQVGNFAIASHRMAYGGGFKNLHQLQIGDHIYVETADGWYSYVFRSLQYVQPTDTSVVGPVPEQPKATPVDRYITMTTCNPFFSTRERLIAYGVYDGWWPRAGGPPPEIAATVAARSTS
jgi:sortase A